MMQKPKILAADNTKVALRYMETILGDIYDVTLVQTGMSVLDCLKSEIPDLILMNANMFGMDGYEVLRRIKEDKETKEIPVILMMNVKDIQSELRGLEEGAISVRNGIGPLFQTDQVNRSYDRCSSGYYEC